MRTLNWIRIHFFSIAVSAVIISLFLFFISYRTVQKFAGRRIYTPEKMEKKILQREELYVFGGKPVTFPSSDGTILSGILFVRPYAKRVLLVAHGYRMTKERLRIFPSLFPDDTILLFDIRTHGESSGELVTFGYYEKQDVIAAAEFLKKYDITKNIPLYGIGLSMGSVSLLAAAAEHPYLFKALIIDSPFAHLEEQLMRVFQRKTGLPMTPFSAIMRTLLEYLGNFFMGDVDALEYAKKIMVPTMVIHVENDTLVPVEDAQAVYDALPGKKELWIVPNGRHARAYKLFPEEYRNRILSFLKNT